MTDGAKSGSWAGGLVALAQQWQVVVTAIAAGTALWFGFAEQRRKQVEVNREAVVAAKAAADFTADPYATLAEFRVSYPEHAFCAALGYFLAEAEREAAVADAAGVKRMSDALGVQVERIAAQGGLTLDGLDDLARGAAGDGTAADGCPDLRPPLGLRARAMWPDCRVLVETYAQTRCQSLAAAARRAAVTAAIVAGAPASAPTPPSQTQTSPPADAQPVPQPGPALPGPVEPEPAEPEPAEPEPAEPAPPAPAVLAPAPAACGPTPPTLFLQFTGDAAAAEALRGDLAAAGWSVPGVEAVEGRRPRGDVRFYWPDQAGCAAALAAGLGAATGIDYVTVSLAGRYRNLPRGRMEVWLPGG